MPSDFASARTVRLTRNAVVMIDQKALPAKLGYVRCRNWRQVANAIRDMTVRGAPAIGIAAAMGLVLAAEGTRANTREALLNDLQRAAAGLRATRPTARNLFWAIDRMLKRAENTPGEVASIRKALREEANQMAEEEIRASHRIGDFGAELLANGDRVLTHCNTGTLATVSYGTALAVIRSAARQGKQIQVWATETRPRLQGAKLTAFELKRDRIPVTVIADSAVGLLMSRGMVSKIVVGADRITRDGVINKIGTYNIALAAKAHGIPFYVAAPKSSFDLDVSAYDIAIEERDASEVTTIGPHRIVPKGVEVFNPAFDVTPMELVTRIICEEGVLDSNKLRST